MEDAIRIIEGLDSSNSEENIKAKKMPVDQKASEEFNRPAYQARKLIRTQGEYLQENPNE